MDETNEDFTPKPPEALKHVVARGLIVAVTTIVVGHFVRKAYNGVVYGDDIEAETEDN